MISGMKTKLWLGVLLLVFVAAMCVWLLPKHSVQVPEQRPVAVPAKHINASSPLPMNHTVKVPTGAERLTNAIACMAYTIDLANKLPNEEKRTMMSVAGVFFFHDALMSKVNHGSIVMTTNELLQLFSNAVAKVYTNQLPTDLQTAFTNQVLGIGDWGQSLSSIYEHEKAQRDHPDGALVHGFDSAFGQRNNVHLTVDDAYKWMSEQNPILGKKIKMVENALSLSGVTDAAQSDLKDNCLAFAMLRTFALTVYGRSQPSEFHLYATNYEAVMQWRLVNMFGLDRETAQRVIKNVGRVPVDEFKGGDVQPPAYLE